MMGGVGHEAEQGILATPASYNREAEITSLIKGRESPAEPPPRSPIRPPVAHCHYFPIASTPKTRIPLINSREYTPPS